MTDKQKYIDRLKDIHSKKTGKVLSDDEALSLFESLIVLVGAIYKPVILDNKAS